MIIQPQIVHRRIKKQYLLHWTTFYLLSHFLLQFVDMPYFNIRLEQYFPHFSCPMFSILFRTITCLFVRISGLVSWSIKTYWQLIIHTRKIMMAEKYTRSKTVIIWCISFYFIASIIGCSLRAKRKLSET